MKRALAVLILICIFSFVCAPAFSLTSPTLQVSMPGFQFKSSATSTTYEPYSDDEFPKWALDLRRAECIFFGGIPIALPVSLLVADLAGKDLSFFQALGIACSVSAVITLVDYILGVFDED